MLLLLLLSFLTLVNTDIVFITMVMNIIIIIYFLLYLFIFYTHGLLYIFWIIRENYNNLRFSSWMYHKNDFHYFSFIISRNSNQTWYIKHFFLYSCVFVWHNNIMQLRTYSWIRRESKYRYFSISVWRSESPWMINQTCLLSGKAPTRIHRLFECLI